MSYTASTGITGENMAYSRRDIIYAISTASKSSGVDFSYLLNQAAAESNFDADAKAGTSSATGLYQFIDRTWLSMVERYGDAYGIETHGKSRQEILNMRNDPKASSFMAAAFASENEKFLNTHWGGDIGATELYFAHFMGASGAASFLNARDENPIQRAADLFPRAARANRNVFYNAQTGKARTLQEVYSFFDKKFQNDGSQHIQDQIRISDVDAPIPPEMPAKKITASASARNDNRRASVTNSLYRQDQSFSNDMIMRRARAMREAAQSRSTYALALYHNINDIRDERSSVSGADRDNTEQYRTNRALRTGSDRTTPFSGLIAHPLDLMMLTQTATPTKVIDDNT
ncbi:MAG: transglycosylase SLT domain-containing protein [Alphaproteobacteria bacterium]